MESTDNEYAEVAQNIKLKTAADKGVELLQL